MTEYRNRPRAKGAESSERQLPSTACCPGNRRGSARQPARNSVQRRESGPRRIGSCRRVLLGYRGARMRDVSTHHVLVTGPSRPDWGDNRAAIRLAVAFDGVSRIKN